MNIFRSLSLQIVTILVLSLAVVLLGTTIFSIRAQRETLEQTVQEAVERTSEMTKQALRRSMSENNSSELSSIIQDLGSLRGIDHIRIYDKRGVIKYSDSLSEIGHVVDVKADACIMCHGGGSDFVKTSSDQYARKYSAPSGHRVLGFINPIRNERGCWDAACHAHSEEQTVLGVLDVQMSLEYADKHIDDGVLLQLASAVVTLLAVAAVSAIFVFVGVHRPVKQVIAGTREIASGNLRHRITTRRSDEIGRLAEAFNRMAADLDGARNELLDWSNTLEQKVDQKTRELQSMQEQVLHMEKMASLGKLSSMIAHELNNPLSGILTLAKLSRKRLRDTVDEEKLARINSDLDIIAEEARRCGDIVRNLLFFARAHPQSRAVCNLHTLIERSLRLVQHQIDLQQIEVRYEPPPVSVRAYCDESQLQQVLIALLINAIEAMPDGGTLTVDAATDAGRTLLRVTDTGIGISAADLQRVFEPFFTTKESGFGTGLGLSIVYGIVKQHGGDITVQSEPGHGSSFIISLPVSGDTEHTHSEYQAS